MKNKLQFNQQITFLYTPDLMNTAEFYEVTLALRLALDQGSCRIYLHLTASWESVKDRMRKLIQIM